MEEIVITPEIIKKYLEKDPHGFSKVLNDILQGGARSIIAREIHCGGTDSGDMWSECKYECQDFYHFCKNKEKDKDVKVLIESNIHDISTLNDDYPELNNRDYYVWTEGVIPIIEEDTGECSEEDFEERPKEYPEKYIGEEYVNACEDIDETSSDEFTFDKIAPDEIASDTVMPNTTISTAVAHNTAAHDAIVPEEKS